jgi:hypothetical protein
MRKLFLFAGAVGGGLLLSSCVTYPYETAFSSCESEANSCYRVCEDIPDEAGYVNCQSHCDRSIDRCFDQAYSPYSSSYGYGYGYGYGSPWYGRYGSWYPDSGYFLSFNYYDRYGYRKKRHHPRRDWDNPPPGGGYTPPGSGNNPGSARPREIDRPRSTNRYRQRTSPPISGPNAPNSGGTAPPSYSQPRAPRTATPPSGSQPTYTPAPNYTPPPATNPAPNSSPPPDRPSGGQGPRRAPNQSPSGESPDRDID